MHLKSKINIIINGYVQTDLLYLFNIINCKEAPYIWGRQSYWHILSHHMHMLSNLRLVEFWSYCKRCWKGALEWISMSWFNKYILDYRTCNWSCLTSVLWCQNDETHPHPYNYLFLYREPSTLHAKPSSFLSKERIRCMLCLQTKVHVFQLITWFQLILNSFRFHKIILLYSTSAFL